MTREWIWYPQNIQLPTPFGDVYLSVTDCNHIYVNGGSDGKYITVNKVEYQTSFHLQRTENGSFDLNKDGRGIRGSRTWRCSKGNYNADHMSTAAIDKVKKVLIPLVNEWAVANPEIFDRAEYAHINNKILSLENEVKSLSDDLIAKQQEIQEKVTEIEQRTKSLNEKILPINLPTVLISSQKLDPNNPVDLVRCAVAFAIPQIWEEGYAKSTDSETLELETLGVLVSKFTEWTGDFILKVAIAALEDANFRPEAEEVRTILKKVESL